MAGEISKAGVTLVDRFSNNYKDWLNDHNKNGKQLNSEFNTDYICAETLRERKELTETVEEEEDRVVTDSSPPGHKIHGFKNEIKSLKNSLLDRKVYNEFKSLVVVGEYGVGKTALCQTIFNDDDVMSVYAPMIWVSMPIIKDAENKKISVLKKILKDIGVEEKVLKIIHDEAEQEVATKMERGEADTETETEKEISALLYAIHLKLRWKKYLIVFDDVRDEDGWDEKLEHDKEKLKKDKRWGKYIADGFPKGSGGRVIYTTRDENQTLAQKLVSEEHQIHHLWPLSDVQTVLDIYEDALINYNQDIVMDDKKGVDELMNKSGGIPLAIRLMAVVVPEFIVIETTD